MTFTSRSSNSGASLAICPSSVVHTGVKSLGWENSTAQESPIRSWKLILPRVVPASKSGAVSLMDSPIRRTPLSLVMVVLLYRLLLSKRL